VVGEVEQGHAVLEPHDGGGGGAGHRAVQVDGRVLHRLHSRHAAAAALDGRRHWGGESEGGEWMQEEGESGVSDGGGEVWGKRKRKRMERSRRYCRPRCLPALGRGELGMMERLKIERKIRKMENARRGLVLTNAYEHSQRGHYDSPTSDSITCEITYV
jgi:hypothetical protein